MPKAKKVAGRVKMVKTGKAKRTTHDKAISRVETGILQGLHEALAHARGDKSVGRVTRVTAREATATRADSFDKARVQQVRKRLQLSQPLFAQALNVSPASVRAWEQGQRVPDGPSLRLLEIAEQHPELVLSTVRARAR